MPDETAMLGIVCTLECAGLVAGSDREAESLKRQSSSLLLLAALTPLTRDSLYSRDCLLPISQRAGDSTFALALLG